MVNVCWPSYVLVRERAKELRFMLHDGRVGFHSASALDRTSSLRFTHIHVRTCSTDILYVEWFLQRKQKRERES